MYQWTPEQREWARVLLGRPARVLLAVWILEQGGRTFHQGQALTAVETFGEARTAVREELDKLVATGMLARSEPGPSERRVLYFPNKEHPAWPAFEAAGQCFGLLPDVPPDAR